MSSSEEENFNIDISDDESEEDYAPVVKKKTTATVKKDGAKAATKQTAKKPPARPKAAKKAALADKDDNAGSDAEMSSDGDAGASNGVQPVPEGSKKSASEKYTKLSQLEHILKRPDMYIGSVELMSQVMWTYDSEQKRMINREVKYVPGFFKIVDEILVNAADHKINDLRMDVIKATIDVEQGVISVYNNGSGIPIEMHSKEKMYIPELIFGHLLSGSNYDDTQKKLTGGRNGYGAKLANIYSHEFTVETVNGGQKYVQTWTNNMTKVGKAKITKYTKEEYTRITFRPDLARFGMTSIDEDTVSLLKKRVFDIAGTTRGVKVYLDGENLKIKGFKQYVEMYINSAAAEQTEASGGAAQMKPTVVYEALNPRWEVGFAVSDGTFRHVSFANSISTTKGGTHVNNIADQISKGVIAHITKKNKGATVKPAQIKNHMWIFVNALIENPTFDGQTKENLTLPASKFGSKPAISEDFIKKVQKTPIVEHVLNWAKFKADQDLKKTDGKSRRNRLTGMTKLADANNAGGKYSQRCTLILTEGDSAKALAVAGLGVVGRDNFGVFPLRGKLLNVRDAKHDQIMKNEEIQAVKKIMGLQHNKTYDNVSGLRYGRLMIMTDQDHDGSHIKGLIINFLDCFFPTLLKVPEFLCEFVTPIVRVTKGKQRKDFFTIPEYEQWLEETPDARKWESKYYKGLGTSKDTDARDYFSNMKKHTIAFSTTQKGDRELIELAFSKSKADDRKEWLRQFKPGTYLDHDTDEIPYSDFINKELILFSIADNVRSIPSVCDGLKPGQRKVIWGCFKRKLKKEIKVAQLVGYISEHAAYHHGEQSLTMTIVNLAQDYVGSNNLNLLLPNGQFGTRDQGGKDHASARYIFTEPAPITRAVFHPDDDPLLNYLKDDNDMIEPEYYLPVLPMVLINGAEGIGTGWSTNLPCYNPEDIIANIRLLMDGKEQVPMLPWWRGFRGTIKKVAEHRYDVTGVIKKINDTTVEITELPIHKWTQSYKAELEAIIGEKGDGPVKDYKEHHDNRNVHFVVTMTASGLAEAEKKGLIEFFKLTGKVNTSNMMCFDAEGRIRKYTSPEEIIEDFYPVRLAHYQKRKDHLAAELQTQLDRLNNQARFIQMIVNKQLSVSNRKKGDIVHELRKLGFRPFPKVSKAKAAGETEEVVPDPEEEEPEEEGTGADFDYLLGMQIWSLTREKIEKLLKQASDKEAELLVLLEKTPINLWNTDLDKFLDEWFKTNKNWDAAATLDANGKPIKRKQAVLETRKSIGRKPKKYEDDSEDEFQPSKAKAKPKPGPSKIKDDDGDFDDPPAKKPPLKKAPIKKEESDSETEVVPRGKGKKAITKNEDSDLDMDDDPVPKKVVLKPKKRAIPKKESDSDVEVLGDPAPKGKGKEKEKSSKKRKGSEEPEGGSDDVITRPTKAKKETSQASVTDFFAKKPSEPAKKGANSRTVSGSRTKPKPPAKKVVDSEEEEDKDEDSDIPPPPPRRPTARAAATAKKYVEIPSDDEAMENDSMYQDD